MIKNKYFYYTLLSYVLPVLTFGHLSTASLVYLPVSIILLGYFINLKIYEGKEWPTYISSGLHGMSLYIFGIAVWGFSQPSTLFSIPTYFGIPIYLISSISFIVLTRAYRDSKIKELNDFLKKSPSELQAIKVARERESKINKILNG